MIECNFEYTEKLINKVNSESMKKYNIIIEIAMILILISAIAMFITGNTLLGISGIVLNVSLAVSLWINNRSINRSNEVLIGQKVNIKFAEDKMLMTIKLGEKVLNKVNFEYSAIKKVSSKDDFVMVYFDRVSAVIIPRDSFKTTKDYRKAMDYVGNNYIIGSCHQATRSDI